MDDHNRPCFGIVDLVFFDGASNVQNAGELLRVNHPRMSNNKTQGRGLRVRGSSLILSILLLDLRTFDVCTYITYFLTKILLNLGKK